jgi:hypothetical protein
MHISINYFHPNSLCNDGMHFETLDRWAAKVFHSEPVYSEGM